MKILFVRAFDLLIYSAGFCSCSAFATSLRLSSRISVKSNIRHNSKRFKSALSLATNGYDQAMSTFQPPEHILIAGAGIIGISTAYYLHKNHGIRSTLIDVTGTIAPAASGKAGGFLALDWNDGSPTGPLTRRSFALHQEIANDLGADSIQYRRLSCAAVIVDPYRQKPSGKKLDSVEWADTENGAVLGMKPLGDESSIAQVHPRMLCEQMWKEIQQNGQGTLVQGKVVGAVRDDEGNFVGAKLDDDTIIRGDALLLACGPWTAPDSNIMSGIKYHSVVIPTDEVLSQCVFFSGCGDPEVYVRPDKTAYCTGYPDPPIRVTELPGQEEVRADKIDTILEAVRDATGKTTQGGKLSRKPELEQACYLPAAEDGIPLMGSFADEPSVYIATGHTCWGILLGPASGEAMASLMATGQSLEVDIGRFSPRRYGKRLQPFPKVVS